MLPNGADATGAQMGHLGDVGHPDVQAKLREAMRACEAAGVAAGCIAGDERTCAALLEGGASFVAVGTDLMVLANAVRGVTSRLK